MKGGAGERGSQRWVEMFESSTNGALCQKLTSTTAAPSGLKQGSGVPLEGPRLPPPFCLSPRVGSSRPCPLVDAGASLGGGGWGRRTGPGLAWRLPAATHVWCFWKSDLNAPTPALTPAHSSPGKGADMCTRIEGYRRARAHSPLLKSPQGHLRKMGCPGLGKRGD